VAEIDDVSTDGWDGYAGSRCLGAGPSCDPTPANHPIAVTVMSISFREPPILVSAPGGHQDSGNQ
jgi:hypothetical protein